MGYETINVRYDGTVCFLRLNRPAAENAINALMVEECRQVLRTCEEEATVVVLEGLPDVFCTGADFSEVMAHVNGGKAAPDPEPLYDLWLQLATGPYVTIAHVRGKVNAGGVGFVAACDIALADETVRVSLSEMLFGLFPACVLPFLIRRTGYQKAHYLTLTTAPVAVEKALDWGLIDACEPNSDALVRKHLLRLRRLSKAGITRYKRYMNGLSGLPLQMKPEAVAANKEIFADPDILGDIVRYRTEGKFPWEA
ncbi:MAG: enoyl-CoA hydratase/isomerase [Desulfobacterales bacterium]|nr:enoyl-CoA hydratase/isomerase [Desulfobacterales bacterium]